MFQMLTQFMTFLQVINKDQTLLNMDTSAFPLLQRMMSEKQTYQKLWTTVLDFQNQSNVWMEGG